MTDRDTRTQVVLRPYASPLPLGFFSFAVGMVLIAGTGIGWLGRGDVTTVGVITALFVFPLRLMSTVFAVLTRDTAAATARRARQALTDASRDQVAEPPHEPGVRRQL